MGFNYAGAPKQPITPISSSAGNAPLSKGELTRLKKNKEKNKGAIAPEDEPGYVAKVKKERAKLVLNSKQTKKRGEEQTSSVQ